MMIEQVNQPIKHTAAVETAQILDQCTELLNQNKFISNEGIRDDFLKQLRETLLHRELSLSNNISFLSSASYNI